MNTRTLTNTFVTFTIAAFTFATIGTRAATVALTSVDQLDFENVVKAYDMTSSNSIAANGATFDIGGVTFTRYNWNSDTTFDNLTITNDLTIDNQNSNSPNVTLGGTATDRANLNILLDVWNIGNKGVSPGGDMVLTIDSLANGSYTVQYIVGTSGDRDNIVYYRPAAGPDELLGGFDSGGGATYLITGDVLVTDGNLRIVLADGLSGNGDERRIISGLIVNQIIPEPSAALLGGLGALLLLRRRRDA